MNSIFCSIKDWRNAAKDDVSDHDEQEARTHINSIKEKLDNGDYEDAVDSLLMAASYLTDNVRHKRKMDDSDEQVDIVPIDDIGDEDEPVPVFSKTQIMNGYTKMFNGVTQMLYDEAVSLNSNEDAEQFVDWLLEIKKRSNGEKHKYRAPSSVNVNGEDITHHVITAIIFGKLWRNEQVYRKLDNALSQER